VRPVNLGCRHYFKDRQATPGAHATDVEEGILATGFGDAIPETAPGDRASFRDTVARTMNPAR